MSNNSGHDHQQRGGGGGGSSDGGDGGLEAKTEALLRERELLERELAYSMMLRDQLGRQQQQQQQQQHEGAAEGYHALQALAQQQQQQRGFEYDLGRDRAGRQSQRHAGQAGPAARHGQRRGQDPEFDRFASNGGRGDGRVQIVQLDDDRARELEHLQQLDSISESIRELNAGLARGDKAPEEIQRDLERLTELSVRLDELSSAFAEPDAGSPGSANTGPNGAIANGTGATVSASNGNGTGASAANGTGAARSPPSSRSPHQQAGVSRPPLMGSAFGDEQDQEHNLALMEIMFLLQQQQQIQQREQQIQQEQRGHRQQHLEQRQQQRRRRDEFGSPLQQQQNGAEGRQRQDSDAADGLASNVDSLDVQLALDQHGRVARDMLNQVNEIREEIASLRDMEDSNPESRAAHAARFEELVTKLERLEQEKESLNQALSQHNGSNRSYRSGIESPPAMFSSSYMHRSPPDDQDSLAPATDGDPEDVQDVERLLKQLEQARELGRFKSLQLKRQEQEVATLQRSIEGLESRLLRVRPEFGSGGMSQVDDEDDEDEDNDRDEDDDDESDDRVDDLRHAKLHAGRGSLLRAEIIEEAEASSVQVEAVSQGRNGDAEDDDDDDDDDVAAVDEDGDDDVGDDEVAEARRSHPDRLSEVGHDPDSRRRGVGVGSDDDEDASSDDEASGPGNDGARSVQTEGARTRVTTRSEVDRVSTAAIKGDETDAEDIEAVLLGGTSIRSDGTSSVGGGGGGVGGGGGRSGGGGGGHEDDDDDGAADHPGTLSGQSETAPVSAAAAAANSRFSRSSLVHKAVVESASVVARAGSTVGDVDDGAASTYFGEDDEDHDEDDDDVDDRDHDDDDDDQETTAAVDGSRVSRGTLDRERADEDASELSEAMDQVPPSLQFKFRQRSRGGARSSRRVGIYGAPSRSVASPASSVVTAASVDLPSDEFLDASDYKILVEDIYEFVRDCRGQRRDVDQSTSDRDFGRRMMNFVSKLLNELGHADVANQDQQRRILRTIRNMSD